MITRMRFHHRNFRSWWMPEGEWGFSLGMCRAYFEKHWDVPDEATTLWAVFTDEKPDCDYFTISAPRNVKFGNIIGEGLLSKVRPFNGTICVNQQKYLATMYQRGYRYLHWEYA